MKYGVIFPQTEIGEDPVAVRDFAQAAEALGYSHLIAYDHVLGASAAAYDAKRLAGPYREEHLFHEPMVLFGYLAGVTKTIELVTGVLILPQRQTALVAKQAAEIDVLSGGRLRLGVGIGWNWVEYEALGVPFKQRGEREAEQIRLLRELWAKPLVSFAGKFHTVTDAGLNPLPRRQIPIWLGGMAEAVLKRAGELGDGWFPMSTLAGVAQFVEMSGRVRDYARQAGRNPDSVAFDVRIAYDAARPAAMADNVAEYAKAGATYLSLHTMRCGLQGPEQHIAAMRKFREVL